MILSFVGAPGWSVGWVTRKPRLAHSGLENTYLLLAVRGQDSFYSTG